MGVLLHIIKSVKKKDLTSVSIDETFN